MTQEYDPPVTIEGTIANTEFKTPKTYKLIEIGFFVVFPGREVNEETGKREKRDLKAFYKVTLWGDEAEEIKQLVKAGDRIRVTGYVKNDRYQDSDGVWQQRKTPDIFNPKVDLAFLRAQAGLIHDAGDFADDDADATAAAAIADLL